MFNTQSWLKRAFGLMLIFLLQSGLLAVPDLVSFSGRLKDNTGAPVNGRHGLNLRIFSGETSQVPIWSEDHADVEFVSGKFSVDIGSINAIPKTALDQTNLFLSISLDNNLDNELRRPFTSQIFALKSKYAELADNLAWGEIADATIPGSKIITINACQVVGSLSNTLPHAGSHRQGGSDPLTLEIGQINNLTASLNAKLDRSYSGNTGSGDGLAQTIQNRSINNSTHAKTQWEADNSNVKGFAGVYKSSAAELSMKLGTNTDHPVYLQANGNDILKLANDEITAYRPLTATVSYAVRANQANTLADYSVINFSALSGMVSNAQLPDNIPGSKIRGEVIAAINPDQILSSHIKNGEIVNADINTAAGIDASKLADGSVSNTELQYLDGVSSPLQSQINGKAEAAHNHTGIYAAIDHQHNDSYFTKPELETSGGAYNQSGAYKIGVFDEFDNSDSTKVQDILDDLDRAITEKSKFSGLCDTAISALADNDLSAYDMATGKWKNQSAAEAGLAVAGHNHNSDYYTRSELSTSGGGYNQSGAYKIGIFDEFDNSNSTTVQDVLDDLDTAIAGKANAAHSHTANDISSGTLDAGRIPSLPASKIDSGIFSTDRIPDLNTSKITAGNLTIDRMPVSGTWAEGVTIKPGGGIDAGNNGTTLKFKVIDIGPWDMSIITRSGNGFSYMEKDVLHGLGDNHLKITSISVRIISDSSTETYDFLGSYHTANAFQTGTTVAFPCGSISTNRDYIRLRAISSYRDRGSGSYWTAHPDGSTFKKTTGNYNRGIVTIWYRS
ncbi:MAG: hypothetical protein ABIH39_04540 [Candidatus Margulisiibacteriota bacterium]